MNDEFTKALKSLKKLHDYYDFSDGAEVEEQRIKQWISDSVEMLIKRITQTKSVYETSWTASGKNKVFVKVIRVEGTIGQFEIEVDVISSYKSKVAYVDIRNYPYKF